MGNFESKFIINPEYVKSVRTEGSVLKVHYTDESKESFQCCNVEHANDELLKLERKIDDTFVNKYCKLSCLKNIDS